MGRERIVNTITTGAVLFILLFVFFKIGPSIPLSVTSQQKGEPLIVTGVGKVSVAPDIAKVTIGIEETGSNLKSVQGNVNQKSKNLTDEIKKLGVGESDIKTVSYNVYPTYNYEVRPQTITGYRVATRYEITIEDFDKVNEILVKATEVGANSIGNVNFEINEKTKKEKLQEAREEAVKEAKDKAEGLTRAAGISLGKIINISESQGFSPRPIEMFTAKEDSVGSAPIQANIEPGETELSVMVSLSFEIR